MRRLAVIGLVTSCPLTGVTWAQDGSGARAVAITPLFSISQTVTDNRLLSSSDRQAEAITQISPGLQITSRSGPVQGSLTYSANGIIYARSTGSSEIQNALTAAATAELVSRRLSIDATASIGQRSISAFGAQTATPIANNTNRSEVSTYSIAPQLRGQLLGEVDYSAQIRYTETRAGSTTTGDTRGVLGSFALSGSVGRLGWGLNASRTVDESAGSRRTYGSRLFGSLSAAPLPDVRAALRLGRESNNTLDSSQDTTTTWGAGLSWTPNPRSSMDVDFDRRYFGNSHSVSLRHRLARTVVTYTDTTSVSTGGSVGSASFSLYDLFFEQFASQEPDPVKRDLFVRAYLRDRGLDPATNVAGGFLSSASTVQRTQSLSAAWTGVRTTLTVSAFNSDSRRIGDGATTGGDLDVASDVRQLGLTVSVSYRLTPVSALTLLGSRQKTLDAGPLAGNDLRSITATWSASLGRRTQTSVGLRFTDFEAETSPYRETALFGSLSLRF